MAHRLTPPPPVSELSRAVRGRYPAELIPDWPELRDLAKSGYTPPEFNPELHPLNAEWYFTDASANWIASQLPADAAILILGVPTVAEKLVRRATLVDASPHLASRFPRLVGTAVQRTDVRALHTRDTFDFVVLDPPWYLPEMWDWLRIARRALRPNGELWMPLMLEGTRPTAPVDRDRLRCALSGWGNIGIYESAVEYDVPLYEWRALRAAGFVNPSPWRAADLAVLRLSGRVDGEGETEPTAGPDVSPDEWASYIIGSQVVKVRKGVSKAGGQLIEPVAGVKGFTLDSVSRRDARIPHVDVWTSRNRVAATGDRALLREHLARLSHERSLRMASMPPTLAQILEVED